MSGRNIIIMYHYIRDGSNFSCFTADQFRKHLTYLKSRYRIITLSDYMQNDYKESTCVLTFDDGIRDGLDNCLPILEEFGVKAVFFIPTATLVEKKVLSAHKRHLLLAKLGSEKFITEFNALTNDYLKVKNANQRFTRFDNPETGLLKLILDSSQEAQPILNKIFDKYFNEKEEFEKMYLYKDSKKMLDAGMELGVHGHTHMRLAEMAIEGQRNDIELSVNAFLDFFGEKPRHISYPFGSYNVFTKRILGEFNFESGVTVIEQPNYKPITEPFELNRYDCASV